MCRVSGVQAAEEAHEGVMLPYLAAFPSLGIQEMKVTNRMPAWRAVVAVW